jgi:hypothetical protein
MYLFNVINKYGTYATAGDISAKNVDMITAQYFYNLMIKYRSGEQWEILSNPENNKKNS